MRSAQQEKLRYRGEGHTMSEHLDLDASNIPKSTTLTNWQLWNLHTEVELYAASELYKTKRSGAGFEADTLISYQPKSQ